MLYRLNSIREHAIWLHLHLNTEPRMLPAPLKPLPAADLIRVGAKGDGGYVLPRSVIEKTDLLIGLGLGDNWSFEEEYQKLSGCKVEVYDHTVNSEFWLKRAVLDTLGALAGRKPLSAPLGYWRYKTFFDGRRSIHHRLKVGYRLPGCIDLSQIVENASKQTLFVKADIEGWEFRILDQFIAHPDRIIGFAIELHDTDIHMEPIVEFAERAKEDYVLVHAHGNNYGGTNPDGDPVLLEATWVRNSEVKHSAYSAPSYPIDGLDYPNDPKAPQIVLRFAS